MVFLCGEACGRSWHIWRRFGLFAIFSLSFFRDLDASVPSDQKTLVSPAHGTVDVIDELVEKSFMGGRRVQADFHFSFRSMCTCKTR
ncbi:MAG: hypothetical protein U1G07_24515 [Verrucomicrobiota bacterium]